MTPWDSLAGLTGINPAPAKGDGAALRVLDGEELGFTAMFGMPDQPSRTSEEADVPAAFAMGPSGAGAKDGKGMQVFLSSQAGTVPRESTQTPQLSVQPIEAESARVNPQDSPLGRPAPQVLPIASRGPGIPGNTPPIGRPTVSQEPVPASGLPSQGQPVTDSQTVRPDPTPEPTGVQASGINVTSGETGPTGPIMPERKQLRASKPLSRPAQVSPDQPLDSAQAFPRSDRGGPAERSARPGPIPLAPVMAVSGSLLPVQSIKTGQAAIREDAADAAFGPSVSSAAPGAVAGPTAGTARTAAQPTAVQVVHQVSVAVATLAGGELEVALTPEELGTVRLRLDQRDGGWVVTVLSDRPDTLDHLRRALPDLAAAFEEAGYEDPSFSFGHQQDEGGEPSKHQTFTAARGSEPNDKAASAPPQAASIALRGGLDIKL